jgi:hypothetical protein
MVDSKMTEMKQYSYKLAQLEDSISLIRHCEKRDETTIGYLIVNSAVPETSAISMFYFGSDAICEITPKQYKQILSKKRKLPKGWVLKEVLFDGVFVFDDLTNLLVSLKEWPYFVAIEAQRKSGILEFVCKSGRRWQLTLPGYSKKSHLDDFIDVSMIENINTKPEYNRKGK